jgi:hypothetical protein
MNKGIMITSDIHVSFDTLSIKFAEMLDGHKAEMEEIVKGVVDNFDFEKAITEHINYKIEAGLEKAFSSIDLSDTLRDTIWTEIERRMSK